MVAQALGVNTAGMDDRKAALAAADAIEALMKKVGHPMRLRDVGVPEEGLENMRFSRHCRCDDPVQCPSGERSGGGSGNLQAGLLVFESILTGTT